MSGGNWEYHLETDTYRFAVTHDSISVCLRGEYSGLPRAPHIVAHRESENLPDNSLYSALYSLTQSILVTRYGVQEIARTCPGIKWSKG